MAFYLVPDPGGGFGLGPFVLHSSRADTPVLHLPTAPQQFVPSLGLRLGPVLHLQPAVPVVLINAKFSLRHNPLKVTGANFREKGLPVLLDVLRVQQA